MSNATIDSLPVFAYDLTAADRCDACGARAYVAVGFDIGLIAEDGNQAVVDLLFCAHDYTAHEPAIALNVAVRYVKDERAVLDREEMMRLKHTV